MVGKSKCGHCLESLNGVIVWDGRLIGSYPICLKCMVEFRNCYPKREDDVEFTDYELEFYGGK